MSAPRPFALGGDEFDQSSYWGRVRKFLTVVDPRTLFPGPLLGMPLDQAQALLAKQRAAPTPVADDGTLWRAQRVVNSTVHPQTEEVIPMPFRMSGFVPFGTPIVVGMLLAQGPAQNAFWQWLNQSHNAAINYCNGNKGADDSWQDAGLSFAVATTSAVGVSVGMDRVVQQLKAPVARRFVPFVAVASANLLNISMMRRRELEDGIAVVDDAGEAIGRSVVAAKKAISETAISRVVLPIPILVLSPLMMMGFERAFPSLLSRPKIRIPLQASIVTSTFLLGLPLSLALFRDRGELPTDAIEPQLRAAAEARGCQTVYFNKGL